MALCDIIWPNQRMPKFVSTIGVCTIFAICNLWIVDYKSCAWFKCSTYKHGIKCIIEIAANVLPFASSKHYSFYLNVSNIVKGCSNWIIYGLQKSPSLLAAVQCSYCCGGKERKIQYNDSIRTDVDYYSISRKDEDSEKDPSYLEMNGNINKYDHPNDIDTTDLQIDADVNNTEGDESLVNLYIYSSLHLFI